jgi:hypothetical protein
MNLALQTRFRVLSSPYRAGFVSSNTGNRETHLEFIDYLLALPNDGSDVKLAEVQTMAAALRPEAVRVLG